MGNWRGNGSVGSFTFGPITDGTSALSWSFPPNMTGGVTTPATAFGQSFLLAAAQTDAGAAGASDAGTAAPEKPTKIALPGRDTVEGLKARVLLAECATPSRASYTLEDAKLCMQLMVLVLANRLKDPGKFNARGATSLVGIVKARGQFAGFGNYPSYDKSLVNRIQSMIDIANDPKDTRRQAYVDHVNAALDVANAEVVADPSPGILASWRTEGHGSPGSGFTLYQSILGTSFYYIAK